MASISILVIKTSYDCRVRQFGFTVGAGSFLLLPFLETATVDPLMPRLQRAEHAFAAFELLAEELVEFVKHLQ